MIRDMEKRNTLNLLPAEGGIHYPLWLREVEMTVLDTTLYHKA